MAQKIIVDTDPGVDDVLAILLSLSSPEVSVALISIVFGNTHAPVAHKNLLKIYHALAKEIMDHPEACKRYDLKEKTILALGEDGPIGGEKATAAYFVCSFLHAYPS
jgi:inosine-uridine nucleoside N-ribohydrolase